MTVVPSAVNDVRFVPPAVIAEVDSEPPADGIGLKLSVRSPSMQLFSQSAEVDAGQDDGGARCVVIAVALDVCGRHLGLRNSRARRRRLGGVPSRQA
jgi:hypothetical protein